MSIPPSSLSAPAWPPSMVKFLTPALFMLGVVGLIYNYGEISRYPGLLVTAALAGGYLALSLGANNSANILAIAVGSGALGLGAAWLLGATGELAGAFLAGETLLNAHLREQFVNFSQFQEATQLIGVLIAGMLAAALWLHVAILFTSPVSSTHSVIGGLVGAGVVAQGWHLVHWDTIGRFALVWLISPLVAALLAAICLYLIKRGITYQPNPLYAARNRVPLLVALLGLVAGDYVVSNLVPATWSIASQHLTVSLAFATAMFLIAQPLAYRAAQLTREPLRGINQLFNLPLMLATGFFAFSHGANDVVNVASPLIAATTAIGTLPGSSLPWLDLTTWAVLVGGIGITLGLVIYGERMVRTVGTEITEIDTIRGFCICFSAALVVLATTHLGYPVSTTHTLVGSIVGVGLLREYLKVNEQKILAKIRKCYAGEDRLSLDRFLARFQRASLARKKVMLEEMEQAHGDLRLTPRELQRVNDLYRQQLVKRALVHRILLFWLLTLPVTATLGGLLYLLLAYFSRSA